MEVENPEVNNFELRSKCYFFTYSDCELLHETILAKIKQGFHSVGGRVEQYIVARELHADGLRHHLHAYIALDKAIRKRVPAALFDEGPSHPNITAVRSCKRVVRYVVKDQNFITNCREFVDECLAKWGTSKAEVAKRLISGEPLVNIVKENPQFLFGYSKIKQDFASFRSDSIELKDGRGPVGVWLGGKAGVGKSYWIRNVLGPALGESVYTKTNNPKFWPGFDGERIVHAEDVDVSWVECCPLLKIWADGYIYVGETKGGHFKARSKLFVVSSNSTLEEFLSISKVVDEYGVREPWLRRFMEFYVTERDEFPKILMHVKDYYEKNKSD